MFRRCSLVFGTVVLLLGLGGPLPAAAAPAAKVEVCHRPPGNKANFHTITISSNALAAHLAHGDLTGACENLGETLCDDANACTHDGFATGTTVCANAPVNCNDTNPCTTDSCNPDTGMCEAIPVYAPFPASGQTTAYTADKNDGMAGEVAVPDDGTVQAGATLSYTDNGNGTITDNNTGLVWEKKGDSGDLHDKDTVYYWSGNGSQETIWDWLGDLNAEGGTGYAGHNDWRIPNVKELQSILDYNNPDPGLRINPMFGPTVASNYWSSTSHGFYPTSAWALAFGGWEILESNDKSTSLSVRVVRGGYGTPPPLCAFPASGQTIAYTADKNDGIAGEVAVPGDGTVQAGATLSYTDNGNGTITDNNTGLMWEKKTNRDETENFANLHDSDNTYYWSSGSEDTIWDWLDDVNAEGGTGYAGHNDWRIPNVKELGSIVDYNILYPGPVINPIFGPTTAHGWWSSTSYATDPSFAWAVHFWSGYTVYSNKSINLWVRAVRGGS